jgi:hypothetical protein
MADIGIGRQNGLIPPPVRTTGGQRRYPVSCAVDP